MSDTGQPNTVEVNGFQITSTESAEDMLRVLKPADEKDTKEPRLIKPIPDKPKVEAKEGKPDAKLSKAAARLGQAGGKAAAEARARSREDQGGDEAQTQVEESRAGAEPGSEAVSAEGTGEKPLGKPESDPYARVRQATAQAQQAKRERDQAIAELQRLRSEQAPAAPPQAQPKKDDEAPKPEDFEDWNEYIRADARYVARQEYKAAQEEATRTAEVEQYGGFIRHTVETFASRVQEAFGAEYDTKVAQHIRDLMPTFSLPEGARFGPENVIADELAHPKNSATMPEMMVYLTEHPEAFDYLMQCPTPEIIQWEMRRMAELLSEHPEPGRATVAGPKVQSVSRAYPPVKTVTGSPAAADPNELSDDLPFEEYVKRRNAQGINGSRR